MEEKLKWKGIILFLLMFITGLHYFTRSNLWVLHDFYRRLYYLPIILAAFKFRMQGGLVVSIAVVFLYAPHLLIFFGELNIELINQFLESGMFIIIGLITGYLVEQDYRRGKALEYQVNKLTNLENYTYNILQSIESGVMAFDINGKLRSVNRQVLKILGSKREIDQFIEQKDIIEGINKILKGMEQIIKLKLNYSAKEKNNIFLDITIYPIVNIANVKEGAVLVMEDVTTLKKLESQVKRAERLAAIGQLASGIAHEIRNPLGIIKTISQTLKEDVKEYEIKEGLEIIEHEIDRANRVIKSLLDFAKPLKMKIQDIKLDELLKEIMLVTQKYAAHQQIEISLNNRIINNTVKGDTDKLKQAFINIILNGIQAMKPGGKLQISLDEINKQWSVITFEDQGTGISEEDMDKIFNPFFTTKENGTGLGLSITHRIIEEHNGKIEFQSKLGEGTRVKVYLPVFKEEVFYAEKNISDR